MALREKYSAKNVKNNYSSFWLDNGWDNNTSIFDEDEPKRKGVDLVALDLIVELSVTLYLLLLVNQISKLLSIRMEIVILMVKLLPSLLN